MLLETSVYFCYLLRNQIYSSVTKSSISCFAQLQPDTNLGQLSKPGTVLESARPEDSKTVPES